MQNSLYRTFYVLILFLAMAACNKEKDEKPAPETTKVTIENYDLITVGMTYTQVVNILGQGTLGSPNNYSWSADNINTIVIRIVFSNNTVQSKQQIGLASSGTGGTTGGSTTGGSTTGSSSGGCPATYNGRTVYTGPRGGCYYINSNGNKTYI